MGLFFLFLGASRGPFLSTVSIIIFFILKYNFRKIGIGLSVLKLVFFLIVGSFLLYFASMNFEIAMFERISFFADNLEEIQDDERLILWKGALHQFVSSPIFGDSYLESTTKFFPHNIFVEILMSTGIFGGILFLTATILTFQFFIKSHVNNNDNNTQLYLSSLFLIFFISSFFSGGLFLSFELWITWALITNIYKPSGIR